MRHARSIDSAGTPRRHQLFAVFDDEDAYRRAERELAAMGAVPDEFLRGDAPELERPAATAHLYGRIERFLKGIGGESHMATIYAQHLQHGRVVLAVPVVRADQAQEVTRIITAYGGYEVTYFRDWSIHYMSPLENSAHHLPIHSSTNKDE